MIGTRRALLGKRGKPWWEVAGQTCVAAYQPIGAADLATSYVNLANPGTYDAAPGTAPTFAAETGWTFDGTDDYLTTGIAPVATITDSIFVRFSDFANAANSGLIRGGTNANSSFGIQLNYLNTYYQLTNPRTLNVAQRPTSGVIGFAGATGYLNGSSVGTIVDGVKTTITLYIGAVNNAGTAQTFYNGKIQAIAIYSTTLSPADVAALTSAMNALS